MVLFFCVQEKKMCLKHFKVARQSASKIWFMYEKIKTLIINYNVYRELNRVKVATKLKCNQFSKSSENLQQID